MKKIIIITSAFISISCNTYKNTYDDYKTLNIVINDIEDYIEWLNEDLFQGNINEETYELILNDYNKELKEILKQKL